jgi:hypothetical protein
LAYKSVLTRYFLPDRLNNTNVVTNASGTVTKVLDYYLCVSTRINQMTGGFTKANNSSPSTAGTMVVMSPARQNGKATVLPQVELPHAAALWRRNQL